MDDRKYAADTSGGREKPHEVYLPTLAWKKIVCNLSGGESQSHCGSQNLFDPLDHRRNHRRPIVELVNPHIADSILSPQ